MGALLGERPLRNYTGRLLLGNRVKQVPMGQGSGCRGNANQKNCSLVVQKKRSGNKIRIYFGIFGFEANK